MEKKDVSWDEVVFNIEENNTQTSIRLWHNYNDGKDYLFLPSFFSTNDKETARVSIPSRYKKNWDGKDFYGSSYAELDFREGEHLLKIGKTSFNINIMCSQNIPSMFIKTDSGSLAHIEASKSNEEEGMYRLIDKWGTEIYSGKIEKMRARGNVTFLEDKKPYQINLTTPVDFTGSGIHDKYVLLANREDPSLLRNKILYDMADAVGLSYSPTSIFADIYINNDYRGIYQICEKIDTGEYGIDINTESGESDPDYLLTLEYERLPEAKNIFTTKKGQNADIKRPKETSDVQYDNIVASFQDLENSVGKGVLNKEKLDIKSFALKYIMEEFSKNLDAMHASQYFYRDKGKIYAGPVWDYDKTLGNPLIEDNRPVNFKEPYGIFAATSQNGASFWKDLYETEDFKKTVAEEYEKTVLPVIHGIDEKIDLYTEEIYASALMEYVRWDSFEDQKYERDPDFEGGYEEQINIIRNFIKKRRDFLSDIWIDNKKYDRLACDPGEGILHVGYVDAVEGRPVCEPKDPVLEGKDFKCWIRDDTGEEVDFKEKYDGIPFILKAVYE